MQIDRRAVKETVGNRVETVLHEAARHLIGCDAFKAIALAAQLPGFKRRAIEQTHKHVGRLFTIGLRHTLFNKRGHGLKALCPKGFQRTPR